MGTVTTNTANTEAPRARLAGLNAAEVLASRQRHGANVLTPAERDPWWKLYLEKFEDPVIRILLIAAGIAIAVGAAEGHYTEGIGIIVAILLATTLAFLNEYKANREFDVLNQVNDDVPVKVIREAQFTTVPRRDLVVGDVMMVEIGEEIPADANMIEAVQLQVDESKFTGESLPVRKTAHGGETDTFPENKLLRGSMIMDGHGTATVSAVGDQTEIGKTARAAAEETGEETPLNQQLERLSKVIGVVGLGVAALTFLALVARDAITGALVLNGGQWLFAGIFLVSAMVALSRVWLPIVYDGLEMAGFAKGRPDWIEQDSIGAWVKAFALGAVTFAVLTGLAYFAGLISPDPSQWMPRVAGEHFLQFFMIAVTLIVVAVPEGLAMSVTLSLAYSMRKMTAANTLVRRMHACETIGAATVICSDKTGTLTLNEMRVAEARFPTLTRNMPTADSLVAEAMAANSTANLGRQDDGTLRALGNPTEGALLLYLSDSGVDYVLIRDSFPIETQWTFSTERKYMATLGTSPRDKRRILHVKGAPEIVLNLCQQAHTPDGLAPVDATLRQSVLNALLEFQARGMRTLGFAWRDMADVRPTDDLVPLAQQLTWLGFVAIADPVRPDVPDAVRDCARAGVGVKMVTGDNPQTAREIARQIGLLGENEPDSAVMTGPDFGKLDDEAASAAVGGLRVLSRARPMDKMRLVKLLQGQQQVVAVTGDGTNDAPALNYANVGLAMGKTGTSVAKEASDIVLLDDSFTSIVRAIMWGRSLYQNIQKFILFQLTINVAALGIALLGPFIGVQLPLTVTQMLWVNLIMDTFAALALATEPPNPAVMRQPPRHPDDFIVSPPMARSIFGAGLIFVAIFIAYLWYAQQSDGGVSVYELTYFFTGFVLLQFWNLFNARTLGTGMSAFHNLGESRSLLIIALAILAGQFLVVQFGGEVFRTTPLSVRDWLVLLAGSSVVLWVGEIMRLLRRGKAA